MVKRWRLRGIGLGLLQLHLATMEKFDNTDLAQLSAKYYDAAAGYTYAGEEQMFPMGFGQVPAVLAKGLDVQLKTTCVDVCALGGHGMCSPCRPI